MVLVPKWKIADHAFSDAELTIAELLVTTSEHGLENDPRLDHNELAERVGLAVAEVTAASIKLSEEGFVFYTDLPGGISIGARPKLFAYFDRSWKDWNPEDDAILLAQRLMTVPDGTSANAADVADELLWNARRANSAIAVLEEAGAVQGDISNVHPWSYWRLYPTARTNMYLESKSR